MKEYNVIVNIDEDGNIIVETKGIVGKTCVEELDTILKGIEGDKQEKNKPEYYQNNTISDQNKTHNKTKN